MSHAHEEHEHEEEKLRWISSPLKHDPVQHQLVPASDSDLEGRKTNALSTDQEIPWDRDGELHNTPQFHRHHEAQSVELFYDLFFVANLTTFTSNHNINSFRTLSSYVGFFCILWFTWYNATLYDVRFAVDNVLERVFKLINFGVMMGFAAVGSNFDPDNDATKPETFRQLTLILMASRLTLVAQYSITLFWTRKYRQIVLPLVMVISMSFIAAVIYFGLFFASKEGRGSNAFAAWYVIAVAETALTTVVSCKWRIISFKGTHLQERLSLLTLIILGEGIILLCKSISYIVKASYIFTSDTIGGIICALLIIVLYYQVYFDRIVESHFGTIRQQIWSFIHFPFHIALVLVLEGVRQFVIWRQAIAMMYNVTLNVLSWDLYSAQTPEYFEEGINTIWEYSQEAFSYNKDSDISIANQTVYNSLQTIANITSISTDLACNADFTECTVDSWSIIDAMSAIMDAVASVEFTMLGMKPKKTKGTKKPTPSEISASYLEIFNFIFVYFFITAGLVLIITGVLHWISKPPKKIGDWIRGGTNFVIGTALCLLSTMSVKPTDKTMEYQYSPWILPTLVLALFVNVVANHVRRPRFLKKKWF